MAESTFGVRIRALHEVTSLRSGSLQTRIRAALAVVTDSFGLDAAALGPVGGEPREKYSRNGSSDGSSADMLRTALTCVPADAIDTWYEAAVPVDSTIAAAGIGCFIAAPVEVADYPSYSLCFVGREPRQAGFDQGEVSIVAYLARWIAVELTRSDMLTRAQDAESMFRGAFDSAGVGMALVAPDGHFIEVNDSLCAMMGRTDRELMALSFQQITHPDDLDLDLELLTEVIAGQRDSYRMEKRYVHRDGELVHANLSVSCVRSETGEVKFFVSIIEDITTRKAYEEQLVQMAFRDPLTGLYNRRHLHQRLTEHLALAQRMPMPISVIYLDLDGFKAVNDQHGHDAGDQLLIVVAERLQHVLRTTDILSRPGGDEFVALLANTPLEGAQVAADRVHTALVAPIVVQTSDGKAGADAGTDTRLLIDASVGIAVATTSDDAESLLHKADLAMFEAKRDGGGVRVYSETSTQS